MTKEIKCNCGEKADWAYGPGYQDGSSPYHCDVCVPRGCSCNFEPKDGDFDNDDPENWEEQLDDQGRKIPCCEYWPLDDEDHEEEGV